jgi:hypothetical protein
VTNPGPSVTALITSEISAVSNALAPFLQPLVVFLTAVRNLSARLTVNIQGLNSGLSDLTFVVQNVLSSLGLPGLNIPAATQALTGLLGLLSDSSTVPNTNLSGGLLKLLLGTK